MAAKKKTNMRGKTIQPVGQKSASRGTKKKATPKSTNSQTMVTNPKNAA